MSDFEVRFPSPCSEPWEDMAPSGCDRHCASCDRIVHDLAALTVDETEALLDSGEEVCVRARIGADGVVAMKSSSRGASRRMVTALGAGLAMATAACQTVPPSDRPDRFRISGEFSWIGWTRTAELRSSDGRKWPKRREAGSGRFIFDDLYPGVYTLTVEDMCGRRVEVETVTITDASVEVKAAYPQDGCIIVGAMVKVERPERA